MEGRASTPPHSRFKATYRAKSGFSGIWVPEDLFGFCSPPPTNMYYVNGFAGIGPGIGVGAGLFGNSHNCSGSGLPGY